jgi:hypothetical protein
MPSFGIILPNGERALIAVKRRLETIEAAKSVSTVVVSPGVVRVQLQGTLNAIKSLGGSLKG